MDKADLYIDEAKFSPELKAELEKDGVVFQPYNNIYEDIKQISEDEVLMIDPVRLNYALYNNIPENVKKVEARNPEILFKALKNEGVESLLGMYFPQFDFNEEDIRRISMFQSATPGDFGNLSSRLRFMNQEKVTETYITDELCKMQEEKELGKRSIGFSD